MAKTKKVDSDNQEEEITKTNLVDQNSIEWSDYVLGLLCDDEKIKGNPTTDGLRRIFEKALNCTIIGSLSNVVQSPDPHNEKRATVVHSLTYVLNDRDLSPEFKTKTVSGAADVYWGNCDKIYRNHPVAVAETRAEGRALRRGLKLRKVVAAEEIAENIEDDPNGLNVDRISDQQINFIDTLAKRNNINIKELMVDLSIDSNNIRGVGHEEAVTIIQQLSKYQQNIGELSPRLIGYESNWR